MKALAPLLLLLSLPLTAADPGVVATFGDVKITETDIRGPIENQLRQLRDAEYNLKRQAIEQHVFQLIRARMAAKDQITDEALWKREVEGKIVAPAAAEVDALVQQYRNRLPADEAQAKKVIFDAIRQQRIQERERVWRSELLAAADFDLLLEPVRYSIPTLPGDAATGPAGAPVTIVEFSDFQCPYCAQSQTLMEQIKKQYGDRVRFVFKQLPLDIHAEARFAAEASLCARDQEKFTELHDWLFANPSRINIETLKEVTPEMGLDVSAFEKCLVEKRHAAAVEEQIASATAMGIDSTPTFFINGRKVGERSLESFARMIDEELPRVK